MGFRRSFANYCCCVLSSPKPMSNSLNSVGQESSQGQPCQVPMPQNLASASYRTSWQQTLSTIADQDLPSDFPNVETPRFLYGDRLRWISNGEITDWGIAIGRFYSFAPHRCCWRWCYLIWLDADSPSAAWVQADIAWEDDLEPTVAEETL